MEIPIKLQNKINEIIELLINEDEQAALDKIKGLSLEEQEQANYVIATLFDTD